jgi:O-antigen ligase
VASVSACLIALPFLQALPTDQDRVAPLLFILPALWRLRRNRALVGRATIPRLTRMEIVLITWVVVAGIVAMLGSRHMAASLVLVADWILFAGFALHAGLLLKSEPEVSVKWLEAITIGSAAASATALISHAIYGGDTMFPYPHHRLIGYTTVVGVIAALHLLATTSSLKKTRGVSLFAAASAIWAAGLWSGSRTPLAALAGAIVFWLVRSPQQARRRLAALTTATFGVGFLLAQAVPAETAHLGFWNALKRTASAGSSISRITSTRSDFWQESLHHYSYSPFTGLGPDAYRYLTPSMDGLQPHNFVIQWLLDFGLLGAVPLLIVAIVALRRGWSGRSEQVHPWAALFTVSLLSGLLDGNLYHFLGLFPAMLAGGVCLASASGEPGRTLAPPLFAGLLKTLIALAAATCLSFAALHTALALSPVPAGWQAPLPKILRAFPVTTYGVARDLSGWISDWTSTRPTDALEASRWAQTNTSVPTLFHVHAAQILQRQGDTAGAARELRAGREKANAGDRPEIDRMLRGIAPANTVAPIQDSVVQP